MDDKGDICPAGILRKQCACCNPNSLFNKKHKKEEAESSLSFSFSSFVRGDLIFVAMPDHEEFEATAVSPMAGDGPTHICFESQDPRYGGTGSSTALELGKH